MWLYKYPNSGRYCTELLYTDVKRITQKLDTRQTACYLVYQARPILSLDRLPYAPPPTSGERENRQPATINAYLIFLLIILTVHVELLLSAFFHARPDVVACLPEDHEPLDSLPLFHSPRLDHLLRDKLFHRVNTLLSTGQQKEGSWIKKAICSVVLVNYI